VNPVRRLRVLVVSPELPRPASSGFAKRVYWLARHLARRHLVTLLCYAPSNGDREVAGLRHLLSEVIAIPHQESRGLTRRLEQVRSLPSPLAFHARQLRGVTMQKAIDQTLRTSAFDVVQIESSQMCGFEYNTRAPIVIDEHNIEYELLMRMYEAEGSPGRRAFNYVEYRKFRRSELRWWQEASGCATTSEREQRILQSMAPATPTAVVPNAVDLDYFRPSSATPQPGSVLFVGLLTYRPNLEAVRFLVSEIMPKVWHMRPDARLTVVGHGWASDLEQLRGPRVVMKGWVPDVRPYLEEAAVVVTPVRIGSGTRFKVLEALAMGKAVVSTSVGCEGLNLRHGEHLLVADEPGAFASHVLAVLNDPSAAIALGEPARAVVSAEYSWDQAGVRLEDLYAAVLNRDDLFSTVRDG
jgi:polysaccharide biosynthesis protein PslH